MTTERATSSTAWRVRTSALAVIVGVGVVAASYGLGAKGGKSQGDTPPRTGIDWNSLATGEMAAFVAKRQPEPIADVAFQDGTGKPVTLAAFKGRIVVLNLWATWCVPCRKEMPALDRLQDTFKDQPVDVIALSVDRGGAPASVKFFGEINIRHLKIFVDPTARLHTAFGARGLPATLLIDGEGREIGRLTGPAEWDSAEAKALVLSALRTLR